MSWRRLFPAIFLFSCVDGFISNLFYPAKLPFLLKDIFILIVYLIFFTTRESQIAIAEFKRGIGLKGWCLVILLMLLGVFQMFNPGVPSILIGILGFKTMFLYWPLAILGFKYIENIDSLKGFIRMIVYISVPICIFGIYQFWQGPDFMVRVFGPGFKRALLVTTGEVRGGTFLRVFGTFGSSGQFANFLFISVMFILALLFTANSKSERFIAIGCLVLNYIAILTTGTRGGLLNLFIGTTIFVMLCRWLWRTFFIILLLSVSLGFGFNYLGKAVLGRFETLKDTRMIRLRTVEATGSIFKEYLEEHPFGKGLGTGGVASRHLVKEEPVGLKYIENYPSKLLHELGIIGVVLFYLFLINLVIHWFRHWLKVINPEIYVFMAVLTSYCWAIFFVSLFGIIDAPPIAIFLWLEIGIAAKLARLYSNDKYPLST